MARRRWHTRAFKLLAVSRMEGASDVARLAAELGVDRGLLYKWSRAYRAGGEAALRLPGERAIPGAVQSAASSAAVLPAEKSGTAVVPGAVDRAVPVPPVPPVPAPSPALPAPNVAALERKVAQQALELDFFRAALRHFAARRHRSGGGGETGSTP